MGRLSRALSSLIQDLHEPRGQMRTLENRGEHGDLQTLESHGANQPAPHPLSQSKGAPQQPTHDEVLNYLGRLADDYHLPRKLVYAVADAESSIDPRKEPHPNYKLDKHKHIVYDKEGKAIVKSWDYGLMQVNSSNIERGEVKDAHGHRFKIGEDVKTDWKANARAGVALLAPAYRLAEMEQGSGATPEDHAQQAYSQYNTGKPELRDRYLKERRDGMPANDADRNFLVRYRRR
jgi:soluble lytic murein transglycosylase-like protein